jgi:hypothetical protein
MAGPDDLASRAGSRPRSPVTVRRARPTRKHRLAIIPGILGTVYGVSPDGEARYFDYDRAAAEAFAGITPGSDLRFSVPPGRYAYVRTGCTDANPGPATRCLWVKDQDPA